MYFVIVYDVESNRVRRKVIRELNGWGNRVQKSVFEVYIPIGELERMNERISKLLENNDSYRVYFKDKSRNEYIGKNIDEFVIKRFEVV